MRFIQFALALYAGIVVLTFFLQRKMLYFPSHSAARSSLQPWKDGERTIGFCREVRRAKTIWFMMHGNAGQASNRDYVLDHLPREDSFYVLEYPGYGLREGKPNQTSINQAAVDAYETLRARHPDTPIGVIGESLGSGPACHLTQQRRPPDKVVLVVPYDSLLNVAAKRFFFLPVRLLLRDRWDNAKQLQGYEGPIEIYGAENDKVIPVEHAKALAKQVPAAEFTRIRGGHNDWSLSRDVIIKM